MINKSTPPELYWYRQLYGDLINHVPHYWRWLVMVFLLVAPGCAWSADYTNEQYADAIRKAEGTWTYGIKTVKCKTENECRTICLNTIKNNRKRYKKYGYKKYPRYIEFLQARYCPTAVRNLTASEKKLNGAWLHNVEYFLAKSK